MIQVVLVDECDKEIGLMEKVEAHSGEGRLHRAFTILVFNDKGETLVTQRSVSKMLQPLIWDNTCAGHPTQNESLVHAGERRLSQEVGFTCQLEVVDRFQYEKLYIDIGVEKEVCTTLIGKYNGEVHPVVDEVNDFKWLSIANLKKDMAEQPDNYTVWLKIALDRLIEQGTVNQ